MFTIITCLILINIAGAHLQIDSTYLQIFRLLHAEVKIHIGGTKLRLQTDRGITTVCNMINPAELPEIQMVSNQLLVNGVFSLLFL